MVMGVGNVPMPSPAGLFKDKPEEATYMATLAQRISGELASRSRDDVARANMMLMAPGGAVYAVYVSDTGALATAKISG